MDTASKHNRSLQAVLFCFNLALLASLISPAASTAADPPGLKAWQAKRAASVSAQDIGGAFYLPVSAQEELQPVIPNELDEGELQLPVPGQRPPGAAPRPGSDEVIQTPSEELIRGEPLPYDGFPTQISSGSWLWDGCWYTHMEMAMLDKSDPRDVPLAFDGFNMFTTSAARQGFEPGVRMTLGRILGRDRGNRDHAVEVTYLGLFDWEGSAAFNADDSVPLFGVRFNGIKGLGVLDQFGGPTGTTNLFSEDALTSRFTYRSRFDSVELNFRVRSRPVRDRMIMQPDGTWERHETPSLLTSFFGGMRYMRLDESFLYDVVGTAFGSTIGVSQASPIPTYGAYDIITHNKLVGLQFGGESIEQHASWHWGVRGKLGGFVNFADRQTSLNSTFGSTFEGVSDENLVFLAEGAIFGSYQIRPNMALTASYDFMFIQGVALASENVGVTTLPLTSPIEFRDLNTNGGVFFNGLFVGFNMVW